jgi:dTDP-4-amino-4,6-dideoxygalactose transaminase
MKSLRFDLEISCAGSPDALRIPFVRPNPPRLSLQSAALAEIEKSGVFSNYGPMNTRLEERFSRAVFQSERSCVTVANATLGLMLAIKLAVGWNPRRRYALMPSFTFAAAAQAALWCGLTPLFCDVDAETWLPAADAEDELLAQYGDDIAVLVPNATFGNCLDLARYHRVAASQGIPLVVDAAAALGNLDRVGAPFGLGSAHPVIFSMHATKAFATAEGGLVYCTDQKAIAAIRAMGNFGFGEPHAATLPGLNSKMSEVCALLGLIKLSEFEAVARRRHALFECYRAALPEFAFQKITGRRTAHQFVSVLVPESYGGRVEEVIAALRSQGIGAGRYFVPHLAEQPFFQQTCVAGALPVTQSISRRIIALPMSDSLTEEDVHSVCAAFRQACEPRIRVPSRARSPKPHAAREIRPERTL